MPPTDLTSPSTKLVSNLQFHLYNLIARDAIDDGIPNPRGRNLANLAIAFACLSFFFVGARLGTRVFLQKLEIDDWFIVPALLATTRRYQLREVEIITEPNCVQLMALAMAVTFNMEAKNGFGLHTSQVSKEHKIEAFKVSSNSSLELPFPILPATTNTLKWFFAAQLFPIEKSWNKALPGSCIQIGNVWYSTSVMAIVTDLIIIVLPIYQIRRLQLPLSQKFGLILMFSLGFFVIACTVVRMATVGPAITATDTMYYQATSNSWTFLEVNVSIICASLPILKAPIVKFCPWLMRNKTTTSAYGVDFSKDNYGTKNALPSHDGSARDSRIKGITGKKSTNAPRDSDEEFILEEMGTRVRKTTEFDVSYETRSIKVVGGRTSTLKT
ncbi:integral membrane protein [Botrytis cinerea]